MKTASYLRQVERWPKSGRHILAQCDSDSVVVYQAYRPEIGHYAAKHGRFGGPFSYSRMSWVKPTFLWMMYRSDWGTKPGQEVTLAIELSREFFDEILEAAVPSSYDGIRFASHEEWQTAVRRSPVRLQWDPDYNPAGGKMERRAIQLGLRGSILKRFGHEEALSISDVSTFVEAQKPLAVAPYENLVTPCESVYTPRSLAARRYVQLDAFEESGA